MNRFKNGCKCVGKCCGEANRAQPRPEGKDRCISICGLFADLCDPLFAIAHERMVTWLTQPRQADKTVENQPKQQDGLRKFPYPSCDG